LPIPDFFTKNFTILFELRYETGMQSVKVEINKRTTKNNTYEMKNFYGISVKTLAISDSFAHKLIAAMNRKSVANRDFYDIWFLFKKGVDINEKILMEITGKESREYCRDLRSFIEKNFSESNPLAGLGELIDKSKKDWVPSDTDTKLKTSSPSETIKRRSGRQNCISAFKNKKNQ